MPPKKDDKKNKKGGAPGGIKEFHPEHYIRHPVEIDGVSGVTTDAHRLLGRIANIEALFQPWDDNDNESWQEPITDEQKKDIVYPASLEVAKISTFAEYFNLGPSEPVDPKAKKKEASKKGNALNAVEFELKDATTDENGKPLPVMFKGAAAATAAATSAAETEAITTDGAAESAATDATPTDDDVSDQADAHMRYQLMRDFKRQLSNEQIAISSEQAILQSRIVELNTAASTTAAVEDGAPSETTEQQPSPEVEQLQNQLQQLLAERDIGRERPQGGYIDAHICNAYNLIRHYVPSVVTHQISSAEELSEEKPILDQNYLWRSIYPKLPNGKPCFNPAGKYCVKLYLAGQWRKIYVDDSLPLRSDGLPAVASSDDKLELWPIILAKAIYTVYSACGYSTHTADVMTSTATAAASTAATSTHRKEHAVCHKITSFIAFAMHLLTGWQPHAPVDIRSTFIRQRAVSAKLLKSLISEGVARIDEANVVHEGIAFPWDVHDNAVENTEKDELDAEMEAFEQSFYVGGSGQSAKTGFTGYTADFTAVEMRKRKKRQSSTSAMIGAVSGGGGTDTIEEGADESSIADNDDSDAASMSHLMEGAEYTEEAEAADAGYDELQEQAEYLEGLDIKQRMLKKITLSKGASIVGRNQLQGLTSESARHSDNLESSSSPITSAAAGTGMNSVMNTRPDSITDQLEEDEFKDVGEFDKSLHESSVSSGETRRIQGGGIVSAEELEEEEAFYAMPHDDDAAVGFNDAIDDDDEFALTDGEEEHGDDQNATATAGAAGGAAGDEGHESEDVPADGGEISGDIDEEIGFDEQEDDQLWEEDEANDFEDDIINAGPSGNYSSIASTESKSTSAALITHPVTGQMLKTKKTFKSEYLKRKHYKDNVTSAVMDREQKITQTTAMLNSQALTEVFFVAWIETDAKGTTATTSNPQNTEGTGENGSSSSSSSSSNSSSKNSSSRVQCLPILAICYDAKNHRDIMSARLLVEWAPGTPTSTPFNPNPDPDNAVSSKIQGIDDIPLPPTTPLVQRWFTIRQLMRRGAFLIGLDTQLLTPCEASLCRHWVSNSTENDGQQAGAETEKAKSGGKAGVGGGKDKNTAAAKGSAPAATVESDTHSAIYADPGAAPLTLLSLDTSQFYINSAPFGGGEGSARPQSFFSQSMASMGSLESGNGQNVGSSLGETVRAVQAARAFTRSPLQPKKRQLMRVSSASEREAAMLQQLYEDQIGAATNAAARGNTASNGGDGSSTSTSASAVDNGNVPGMKLLRRMPTNTHYKSAKAEFLHFTLMIHADVVTEYIDANFTTAASGSSSDASTLPKDNTTPNETGNSDNGEEKKGTAAAAAANPHHANLPSDVVLVLQELRFDDIDPLIFVVNLDSQAFLPITTKSFAISSKRLPPDPTQPMLFWVRLFTKASVFIQCSSEVPVFMCDAETMWGRLLDRPLLVAEGNMGPTPAHTQQLLFRLPLLTEGHQAESIEAANNNTSSTTTTDAAATEGGAGDKKNGALSLQLSANGAEHNDDNGNTAALDDDVLSPLIPLTPNFGFGSKAVMKSSRSFRASDEDKPCLAFLYVQDRTIERNINMAVLGPDITDNVKPFPRIQGNLLHLCSASPRDASTLLARVYPTAKSDATAEEEPSVPGFKWKLVVLSLHPIEKNPKPIQNPAISQRFKGCYIPNRRNALFRDVFTIDKFSFPLALRLTTKREVPTGLSALQTLVRPNSAPFTADGDGSDNDRSRPQSADSDSGGLNSQLPESLRRLMRQNKSSQDEIALVIRLYRLPDMKLIIEYKGKETVLCYNQPLHPFLEDGDHYDIAAAAAAVEAAAAEAAALAADPKAAAAAAKKNAGKKDANSSSANAESAQGSITGSVNVLVECMLDDFRMNIPPHWTSRFPHQFDQHYTAAAAEALATNGSSGGGAAAAFDGSVNSEAIQLHVETLDRQSRFLKEIPPTQPVLKWTFDIVAGKVTRASHDTVDIQQQLATKKQWETGTADGSGDMSGRSERAAAAAAYFKERRRMEAQMAATLSQKINVTATAAAEALTAATPAAAAGKADEISDEAKVPAAAPVSHLSAPLTTTMIENIVTALEAETAAAGKRYGILHKLPKYIDHARPMRKDDKADGVSLVQEKRRASIVDPDGLQRQTSFLSESAHTLQSAEGDAAEEHFHKVVTAFQRLNEGIREQTQSRVDYITHEATVDAKQLGELWEPREQFRLYAQSQNESLQALLGRAVTAKNDALKAEIKAAEEEAKLAEKLRKEQEKAAKKKK